jgi:hypothetical protein
MHENVLQKMTSHSALQSIFTCDFCTVTHHDLSIIYNAYQDGFRGAQSVTYNFDFHLLAQFYFCTPTA